MPTMNISLSEELKTFVGKRVAASSYSTNSGIVNLAKRDRV